MQSLGLEVEGRPDIVINLSASTPAAQQKLVEGMKSKPFTIKEGALFRMKVKFRVQNEVLSGMKYLQVRSLGFCCGGKRDGGGVDMVADISSCRLSRRWG